MGLLKELFRNQERLILQLRTSDGESGSRGMIFEHFFNQVRDAADLSGGAKQRALEALSGARCKAALNELYLVAKQ